MGCRGPDAGWETKIQKEEKNNMEILICFGAALYIFESDERAYTVCGGTFSGRALSAAGNFTLSDDPKNTLEKKRLRGIPKCIWKWLRNGKDGRKH